MNDRVLRARLARGRASTDIHAPASLTLRHTPTVCGSRAPPAQDNLNAKLIEDKVGAHRLLNTGAGNQQVRAKKTPVQRREAVRPPTSTPSLAPPSLTRPRRKQEASHVPASAVGSHSSLPGV